MVCWFWHVKLLIFSGNENKSWFSSDIVGWRTSGRMTLIVSVDTILANNSTKPGVVLYLKDSFSRTPPVRKACAFCGDVLANWDKYMQPLLYYSAFSSVTFTEHFVSNNWAQGTASICQTDWCLTDYCSDFTEAIFLDNEVAFWGFHNVSEVFSVSHEVVEERTWHRSSIFPATDQSSAYRRWVIRSFSTISNSGRTAIPYNVITKGSPCVVLFPHSSFLWLTKRADRSK